MVRHADRGHVLQNVVLAVLAVGLGVLLVLFANAYTQLNERADRARERSELSASERERLAADIDILRQQLIEEGIAPARPPAGPDPVPDEDAIVVRGETGERGPVGPRGPRGFPGIPGEPGADSDVPGPRGPAGDQGEAIVGPSGPSGDSVVGPAGPPGPAGEAGSTGPQGEPGPAGATGQAGAQGPAGSDGADGSDGRGITAVTIEGDARDCQLVITYTSGDPDRIDINPLVCLR